MLNHSGRFVRTCPACQALSVLSQTMSYQDGTTVLRCGSCGGQIVDHCCYQRLTQSWWLPILESGLSLACPTCGLVYQVAEDVAESPLVTPAVRSVATAVAVGALLIGGLMLVGSIADQFRSSTA